jgi:hypothetical protein
VDCIGSVLVRVPASAAVKNQHGTRLVGRAKLRRAGHAEHDMEKFLGGVAGVD